VVEIFFEQADKLSAVDGWLCNEVGRKCEADPRDGGSPDAERAVCLELALHGNGKCASVRLLERPVIAVARIGIDDAGKVLQPAGMLGAAELLNERGRRTKQQAERRKPACDQAGIS